MKQFLTPILSFFFLILLYGSVNGQTVTSATSCGELTTNYTDSSHSGNTNDPIFLFEGGTSSGELSFEEVVGATYDWYIFNPSTNSYDEHALNSTPTQTNLSDGGYLVVRTDGGGTITEGRAWVWSTSLVVDAGADIDICNGSSTTINGSGTVLNPSFTYYDPVPRPFKIDNNTIITVTFDAVHSYVSDLAFYLMSPDEATIVTLGVNEPGNPCNPGNDVSNLSFTNDPSIGTQIYDLCGMGAPLTGTYNHYYADYSPASGATAIDMSSLIGYDAGQGGWKVMIYDCENMDTGSLTSASITFNDGLGNTRTYSSGAINVAINDNSCSSGSASIYEVPYITAAPASETLTIATGTGVNSTGGFEWSSSTVGPNGPWGASFNNLTASPVISPDQTTWYRLQIDNGLGCSSEDVIQVSVTDAPNSGVGTDTQACIGDTAIDLNGLLSGEDTGGVWSVSGTSVDAPGMDFDAAAGTYDPTTAGAYTFEYNVTAVSPCTIDAITSVTVTVSSLSDTGTDQQLSITNASGTIDLFSSLGGAPDVGGIWSMDATSTDAGSSFDAVMGTVDTSGLSFGTYVFNYTIASCITSVSTITLEYPNPCGAVDTDGDLINDLCDDDDDGDGYSDIVEMAEGTDPKDENSVPLDTDMDGDPNSTDPDDDGDGTTDANDAFPLDDSEDTDTDGDGTGNNADTDDDGDGYSDIVEMAEGTDPKDENSVPLDTDMDGDPNSTDPDDDGDGTTDANDAFPLDDSEDTDTDGDGTGDNADIDDDGDGYSDIVEMAEGTDPKDENSVPLDTDMDGDPNSTDPDDDGDGTTDANDAFPLDDSEDTDTDGDGTGDNADIDDDGDGYSDIVEMAEGTDPKDENSVPLDTDMDGDPNSTDPDDDGDGTTDANDAFPLDDSEDIDTDGDGTGNNADTDDDGDGFSDQAEIDRGTDPLDATSFPQEDDLEEEPIVPESKIVPAQAFTPNGDGNNDFWVVPGLANYPNNRVTIFNRSGHEVFKTQSYQNNWGGFYKNNNKKLPAGSYFYIIDLGEGSAPLQGWIFINY